MNQSVSGSGSVTFVACLSEPTGYYPSGEFTYWRFHFRFDGITDHLVAGTMSASNRSVVEM